MEGNMSQGGMIPGDSSFRGLDLQGSTSVHHHAQNPHSIHHHHPNPRQGDNNFAHPSKHESFQLMMGDRVQNPDQTISMTNYNKKEREKSSVSDEDEPSFTEEYGDGHNVGSKSKKGSPWQRVKWTDKMVMLLITAVSYIGEDESGDCGGEMRRKFAIYRKRVNGNRFPEFFELLGLQQKFFSFPPVTKIIRTKWYLTILELLGYRSSGLSLAHFS